MPVLAAGVIVLRAQDYRAPKAQSRKNKKIRPPARPGLTAKPPRPIDSFARKKLSIAGKGRGTHRQFGPEGRETCSPPRQRGEPNRTASGKPRQGRQRGMGSSARQVPEAWVSAAPAGLQDLTARRPPADAGGLQICRPSGPKCRGYTALAGPKCRPGVSRASRSNGVFQRACGGGLAVEGQIRRFGGGMETYLLSIKEVIA